ncbi:MAG: hypothetical protein ABI035_07140 [Gemmatimonadaceae bacterium]
MLNHATNARRALVIGIDPQAVAHLGIESDRGQIAAQWIVYAYGCVVIGGGIRKPGPVFTLLQSYNIYSAVQINDNHTV